MLAVEWPGRLAPKNGLSEIHAFDCDLPNGRFGSFAAIDNSVGPMAASARKAALRQAQFSIGRIAAIGCDFNWSMQHLSSHYREGGDANEVPIEDLLHRD